MHRHFVLDNWRWTCPCGARAAEPNGICRKCRARARWQQKITRRRRGNHERGLRRLAYLRNAQRRTGRWGWESPR